MTEIHEEAIRLKKRKVALTIKMFFFLAGKDAHICFSISYHPC